MGAGLLPAVVQRSDPARVENRKGYFAAGAVPFHVDNTSGGTQRLFDRLCESLISATPGVT